MGFEGIPFSELLCNVVDNRGKTCPTANAGIPLIATNCIRNELLYPTYDNVRFVSQHTYSTWFRGHPEPGDILFVNKATPGRVCLVPDPVDFCIAQDMVAVRADPRKIYPKFLFAALRSPIAQEQIAQMHVGTLIPHFKKGDFDKLLLPRPSREVQEFIGDIYFDLSAKIDLNRRMNATLEAMARAIFKSWLVDFDPVRARAAGRDAGLTNELADLFSDRLKGSELGEIPAGWEVSTIGWVANVIDCLHSRKPERRETGMPLLQLANIRDDAVIDMQDTYFIDEADYRKWVSRMEASPGDCVITNVGRVGAVAQMPVGQKAALGRNMTGVRCKPTFPFPTVLIECLLSQAMKNEIALKMDTGTILDALNVRNIPKLRFVRPTHDVLECFEHNVRPLRAQMERHLAESRTLAALRDTLLPELISGELMVSEVRSLVDSQGIA